MLNLTGRFTSALKKRQAHLKTSSKRRGIFGREFAPLNRPLQVPTLANQDHNSKTIVTDAQNTPTAMDDDDDSIDIDLTQTTQLLPVEDYYQERAQAATNIEETIVELGGMFDSLSTMIEAHGETIQRIDDNIEDSITHSKTAVDQLREAWENSDNKMLYFKIFLILAAFLAFFITFLA